MAQTNYDSRSAYLYANALLNQGANPIVDWFTNPQGGGLANWLTDQGNQIGKRINNDLAYKIEHDENLIDKVREAQNQGRDLRKELLQGYFIDPYDETLNTAVDNLNTKAINRLNTDISTAVTNKLNQDNYKGGSIVDEAKNLGWNSLTKEQQQQLKDYEQKALKARYEEGLQREIGIRRLTDPNFDVTQFIQEANQKYGMNLNPADYLNPDNKKQQEYRKAGFNQLVQEAVNSKGKLKDRRKALQAIAVGNSDLAGQASEAIKWLDAREKERMQTVINNNYNTLLNAGVDSKTMYTELLKFSRREGWDDEEVFNVLKNNNNFVKEFGNNFLAESKQRLSSAKNALANVEKEYEDVKDYLVQNKDFTGTKETATFLAENPKYTQTLKDAGIEDTGTQRQFIEYLKTTKKHLGTEKFLKEFFGNANIVKEHVKTFNNARIRYKTHLDEYSKAAKAEEFMTLMMYANLPELMGEN